MKYILITLIFIVTSCSHLESFFGAGSKHLVFDIDWTIVSEVKGFDPEVASSGKLITVEGHNYIANPGLAQLIEEILSKGDVKISFFSGGKRSRNTEILSKIKLRDGRSLRDIAYKILSNEELIKMKGVPEDAPFSKRYKKDLTLISKNLDQLIMLDDTSDFVIEENQKRHVFFIGSSFEYFSDFKKSVGLSGKYIPKNQEEWLLDHSKLIILKGAFSDAYDESVKAKISFSKAMKKRETLLDLDSHKWNIYSKAYYKKFFELKSLGPSKLQGKPVR